MIIITYNTYRPKCYEIFQCCTTNIYAINKSVGKKENEKFVICVSNTIIHPIFTYKTNCYADIKHKKNSIL